MRRQPLARPLQIIAPTRLEYLAVRAVAGPVVVHGGIGLSKWCGAAAQTPIVVCGLAGGLRPGMLPGTILIPREVGLPNGTTVPCDPAMVSRLTAAARSLGYEPDGGPLLTAPGIVTGAAREHWWSRGFVGADMETGLLAKHDFPVATVRVVLDTRERAIAGDWIHARRAALRPALWREMAWMCRAAPTYALRAARVLRTALDAPAAPPE